MSSKTSCLCLHEMFLEGERFTIKAQSWLGDIEYPSCTHHVHYSSVLLGTVLPYRSSLYRLTFLWTLCLAEVFVYFGFVSTAVILQSNKTNSSWLAENRIYIFSQSFKKAILCCSQAKIWLRSQNKRHLVKQPEDEEEMNIRTALQHLSRCLPCLQSSKVRQERTLTLTHP